MHFHGEAFAWKHLLAVMHTAQCLRHPSAAEALKGSSRNWLINKKDESIQHQSVFEANSASVVNIQ